MTKSENSVLINYKLNQSFSCDIQEEKEKKKKKQKRGKTRETIVDEDILITIIEGLGLSPNFVLSD